MAEMPDRPFCAGGGTAWRAGHEHQASAAGDENTGARKWAHDREHRRLTCLEPPYTEPYVRWCGRTGSARARTYPIRAAIGNSPILRKRESPPFGGDQKMVGTRRFELRTP